MRPTVFQRAELRDENDNIVQQGTYGKGSALSNSTNDGWVDYVMNNLEALRSMSVGAIIPVETLPESGETEKAYVVTTGTDAGKLFMWDGEDWVEITGSIGDYLPITGGTITGNLVVEGISTAVTPNADDNSTKVATTEYVQTEIKPIETDVDIAEKDIANIKALLQGNLYDYQTDTDSAYTKTVPSGAMPYAGLEKVGGKTVVWNQQFVHSMTRINGHNYYGLVETYTTEGFTLIGTPSQADTIWYVSFTPIAGHKYLIKGTPIQNDIELKVGVNGGVYVSVSENFIVSPTNTSKINVAIKFTTGTAINLTWKPQIIDLTLMFGSGNEPTVAEFEAMFPASYYSYNAGTLLSAGVTEVESKGKNIINEANVYSFTKMQYEGGVFTNTATDNKTNFSLILQYIENGSYRGNVAEQQATTIGTNSVTFTATVSCNQLSVGHNGSVQDLKLTFYADIVAGKTYTLSINVISNISNQVGGIQFDDVMLEESATLTNYVPYMTPIQYPIPAEVQALEGYGWSADGAYNYIDYERKVYVQGVNRINLGDLSWSYDNNYHYFKSTVSSYGCTTTMSNSVKRNLPCPAYVSYSWDNVVASNTYTGIAINRTAATMGVYDPNAGTDPVAFTTAMSGVYLYYALATPIETDISAYITDDNLIQVEAGGTLTFQNQNGDDYQIPVPSEETYMIDLQEAINNG